MSWSNLAVPAASSSHETPPAGSHGAALVAIVDLGTHVDEYQGKKTKARKALFVWELTSCKVEGAQGNHVIGKELTLSLGEKATLRKMLKTWRGRDLATGENYDILKLLGQPCLVNVTHKQNGDRVYAQFESLSAVPQGMSVAKPQRQPFARGIDDPAPMPAWLPYVYGEPPAEKLARCEEKGGGERKPPSGVNSDRVVTTQGNGAGNAYEQQAAAMIKEDALPF